MREVYYGADLRGIWNQHHSDSVCGGIFCNYELLNGFYRNIMMKTEGERLYWRRYSRNTEGQ